MPPLITTTSNLCLEKLTATTFKQELSHAGYTNGFNRLVSVGEGMTGQINPPIARQRELRRLVRPSYSFVPTAKELQYLLPWCFSGTVTGTGAGGNPYVHQCTDTAVEVRETHYKQAPSGVVETLSSVCVTQASFSCDSANEFLAVNINGLAKTRNGAGTYPASPTAIETTTSPFILPDTAGAVSLAGTPLRVSGIAALFTFIYDEDRFLNALDLTDQVKLSAAHTVSLTFPYGERTTAYDFNPNGDPLIITWTNGTRIFQLTFPLVTFPEDAIARGLRTEVGVTITGRAFRSVFNVDDTVTASLTVP